MRNRQVKNGLTLTLMSLGVPMILMGDEVRRTQQGNNNAYCHDDPSTWFEAARLVRENRPREEYDRYRTRLDTAKASLEGSKAKLNTANQSINAAAASEANGGDARRPRRK